MAHDANSADPGWPDRHYQRPRATHDPALLRGQLARMSESQLRRLLLWLDQRGAATGQTFAVHQVDPHDPASRDLIELRVRGADPGRARPKLQPEASPCCGSMRGEPEGTAMA